VDAGRVIRLNSRCARAFFARAEAHRILGRLSEALADADEALRISPDHFLALACRDTIKLAQGEKRGGRADLTSARAISLLKPATTSSHCA
jgi:tetratricopeptide (TPR) repeat protein